MQQSTGSGHLETIPRPPLSLTSPESVPSPPFGGTQGTSRRGGLAVKGWQGRLIEGKRGHELVHQDTCSQDRASVSCAQQASPGCTARPPDPVTRGSTSQPSPDSLHGCAAPHRVTLLVPELALGHETEQSRFKPTKPLPHSPKTKTLHSLIPRPCHVGPAYLAGSRRCRRGVPLLLALTRARRESKMRSPLRGVPPGPCPSLCSAIHVDAVISD